MSQSKEKPKKLYWTLFSKVFLVSASTFGGGFVIIPILRRTFVHDLKWLEEEEMLDLTAIAQSSPGPIAVNAAVLIGYRMGGVPGALLAALGTVLPPFLIISLVSLAYEAVKDSPLIAAILRGMRSGVAAVICDVTFSMGIKVVKGRSWLDDLILLGAFLLSYFAGMNVALLIVLCGVIGFARSWLRLRRRKKEAGQ